MKPSAVRAAATRVPVASVTLDWEPVVFVIKTATLNAYDASSGLVDTVMATVDQSTMATKATLSVSSALDNIKYFTLDTNDIHGAVFTNIAWGCASAIATPERGNSSKRRRACTTRRRSHLTAPRDYSSDEAPAQGYIWLSYVLSHALSYARFRRFGTRFRAAFRRTALATVSLSLGFGRFPRSL